MTREMVHFAQEFDVGLKEATNYPILGVIGIILFIVSVRYIMNILKSYDAVKDKEMIEKENVSILLIISGFGLSVSILILVNIFAVKTGIYEKIFNNEGYAEILTLGGVFSGVMKLIKKVHEYAMSLIEKKYKDEKNKD